MELTHPLAIRGQQRGGEEVWGEEKQVALVLDDHFC